jgi:3-isopropylmalate/(R)-2-methylmalate dehydratase small subunit
MKQFGGNVLFLDRSNINIDEIIPAKQEAGTDTKAVLFENLSLPNFTSGDDVPGKRIIITRENFGIGEHPENAAAALKDNGIYCVIVSTMAPEFKKAMKTSNLLVVDIDKKTIEDIFRTFSQKDSECFVVLTDEGTSKIKLMSGSLSKSYVFNLEDFSKNLLEDDSWIGNVRK